MTYYVVVYIRVSTSDQDYTAQDLQCRSFAEKNNMTVTRVFIDNGESAWSQVPPELMNMGRYIELLPIGQRPHILCKSVDRFSRNVRLGTEILRRIHALGIDIMFIDTPEMNPKTPEGYQKFQQLLGSAQESSDLTSRRVRESKQARKEAGMLTSKEPPFGKQVYINPDDGKKYLEINSREYMAQIIIAMMYGQYTYDQLMKVIKIYQQYFGDRECRKTIYDEGISTSDCHKIFKGSVNDFADVLNYFDITKRDEDWTEGAVRWQWQKYIEPSLKEFEEHIQKILSEHHVEVNRLFPVYTASSSGTDSFDGLTEEDVMNAIGSS